MFGIAALKNYIKAASMFKGTQITKGLALHHNRII